MFRETLFCPVCTSLSRTSKLVLRQINLTSAVYLCEDAKCEYPEGYGWTVVDRTLNELYSEKQSECVVELDQWLNDVFEKETAIGRVEERRENDFLHDIFKELEVERESRDQNVWLESNGAVNGTCGRETYANASCDDGNTNVAMYVPHSAQVPSPAELETMLKKLPKDKTKQCVIKLIPRPGNKFKNFAYTSYVIQSGRTK